MVAGWGETGFMVNDAPTNPQKQVTVPIVSITDCREKLSTVLTNVDEYLDQTGGEICAGGQSMRDACTVCTIQPDRIKNNQELNFSWMEEHL